ncbi:PTS galactitol transporter subunit IIC [Faecalicatena acetigenes]|jgi:PTS system galactitol-specific IIC component|uniref:PTS galactitol transporter subunit IIC n=1 Tax=Faecalicatena acetigenes TaxID=2981790 RepID=A0ABT2T760_9FIRM|nr:MULTISPECIES: PTS transporter subunit IIC [Lachnospiraceae]MCU6746108.1 PTS galactitol transporter subunit IIC [Faecalicatena acetigenes]RGT74960.1 PTS galactitol transporter subunit IIC [Ruminococcus sp. AF18-22]SCG95642.1 PTS system galactitol-specific EIIC component [uncultured Clostridium sp.]
MLETLSNVFDTFGASVSVPVIIFIIAMAMRAKPSKAFRSALLAGVALTGFSLMINAYMPNISGIVDKMVENTGVNLPVLDVGWQACALVAYSTEIGMAFLVVAIVIQLILFTVKWTNIFMPSDLWNTYSFMLWGSTLYVATKNAWLSMGLMILMNLYVLLFAEILAPCFSSYYNYPGCALTAPHHVEGVPFYVIVNFLMNKLGLNKVNINLSTVQKRLGLFGEPMVLGLFIGFILGFIGNVHDLGNLASWGEIATSAISTAAVMAIFPKIASLFAAAFTLLTESTKGAAKKHGKGRKWYLAVNDATGYGEPATIMVGTLMIPIMLALAFALPGNRALIMVDLIAMPYCMIPMISISKGNMLKTLIGTMLYFSLALYVWGWMADLYTTVAVDVGFTLTSSTMLITSTCFMPFLALLFAAFLSQNPLWIALTVVVYFALFIFYKKNKEAITNYMLTCNDVKTANEVSA